MGTIGALLLQVILGIFKTIFGTDNPCETEVRNAKPEIPLPARPDADLLRELGL
jgi:hypothetical protein